MKDGGAGGGGGGEALGVKKRARGMNEGKRTRAKQETQRRKPKPNPPKMTFVQKPFQGHRLREGEHGKSSQVSREKEGNDKDAA
jgi:hypothetical protein